MQVKSGFRSGAVWDDITLIAQSCKEQRRVAVAYLGTDALRLLPLTKGDELIVAATERNAHAGAINPQSIRNFMDRGVRVWSHDSLHAKVFRLGEVTVVGSANISPTSAGLEEAIFIGRSKSLAKEADAFIDGLLKNSTELDQTLLASLEKAWLKRVRGGAPGVRGTPPSSSWPRPRVNLFVNNSYDHVAGTSETAVTDEHATGWNRECGSNWYVETYTVERNDLRALTTHDLVVLRHTDKDGVIWVYPPGEVLGPPVDVPRTTRKVVPLRYPGWVEEIEIGEFNDKLRAKAGKLLPTHGRIRDPKLAEHLLGMFGLPTKPGAKGR